MACTLLQVKAQTPADTANYEMKPVTITADRAQGSWLNLPLALNVVTVGGRLQGKGYGFDELFSSIPGVLAQSRSGNQDVRLTIRGFGARGAGARSNSGTTRGIRVLIDGFPETEPDGRTSFDLADLSGAGTVEVIRSNASALWGNASGGIINITSNTMFDAPYVRVGEILGSNGFHKEILHFGTTVDAGKLFLSLNNTNSDGWRYHSSSSQTLLNTGLVSSLGERTTIGVYLTGTSNIFRIPGPLTQAQFDSLPRQADSTFIKRDERRNNRLGRLGVTITHELNEKNAISASTFVNTKYLQRSERNRFRDFNRYHIGGNAMFTNKSEYSSGMTGKFVVGIDEAYQDGAIHFYDLDQYGGRGTTLVANKREGANNFGAFFQEEVNFDGQWILTAGGRYDNITYYYDDYIDPRLDAQKAFTRFTPKAGLTFRAAPLQSFYVSLGGGVEVPAGNEVDPSPTFGADTVTALNPLLEPITSMTIEGGTKHILPFGENGADGAFTYDVALYYLEVKNDIIPYSGGAFYFSAGKTRRMGAEFGGDVKLAGGIGLGASVTLSDNEYVNYVIDSVHYGVPGATADLAGNKMAGVPEAYYSVNAKYAPPSLKGAYVQVTVHGTGSYFADDRNLYTVPGATTLDAMIGMSNFAIGESGLSLSAFLGVNNLTDKKAVASAWINPDLVGGVPVYLEPGLPRNVVGSVSLGVNF